MVHAFLTLLLLSFSSCYTDLKFQGFTTVATVSQAGPLSGSELVITGKNLQNVSSVHVRDVNCVIGARSSSQLSCAVATSAKAGWADVLIKFKNESPLLLKKYFAHGGHVVGQRDFQSAEIDLREAFEAVTSTDVIDNRIWVSAPSATYIYPLPSLVSFTLPTSWWNRIDLTRVDNELLLQYNEKSSHFSTSIQSCWNGTQFFALHRSTNRVLVYNGIPTTHFEAPAYIIGQDNWESTLVNKGGSAGPMTLNQPSGMDCHSTTLAIADTANHRVLGFALPVSTSSPSATWVLGQADFTSVTANRGGTRSAQTLNSPYDVQLQSSGLYVADASNHRVLYWNSLPTTNGQSANLVFGQPNFALASTSCASPSLNLPRSIAVGDGWMAVAANGAHRVQLWDLSAGGGISAWVNGRAADRVLGQATMTDCSQNRGVGIDSSTLRSPAHVSIHDHRLYVTDAGNYRVLGFELPLVSNGVAADLVLGQESGSSFNYSRSTPDGHRFIGPGRIDYKNGTLVVPFGRAAQVLIFENVHSNYPGFSKILGQSSPFKSERNNSLSTVSGNRFSVPGMAYLTDDLDVYIGESSNDRILVWEDLPSVAALNSTANFVIGSDSLTGNKTGTGTKYGGGFGDLCSNGSQFFVSDPGPSRIMVYDAAWMSAKTNGPTAAFIIGQATMAGNAANQNGAAAANTINYPNGIWCDDHHLWLADQRNHRILRYSLPIVANNAAADLVLGQPDFTSVGIAPTLGAGTLNNPQGVFIHDGKLYVTDTNNSRILIWDTIPTVNGTLPDRVWGQADFVSSACNRGRTKPSLDSLCSPLKLVIDDDKMAISDSANHRVLLLPIP